MFGAALYQTVPRITCPDISSIRIINTVQEEHERSLAGIIRNRPCFEHEPGLSLILIPWQEGSQRWKKVGKKMVALVNLNCVSPGDGDGERIVLVVTDGLLGDSCRISVYGGEEMFQSLGA